MGDLDWTDEIFLLSLYTHTLTSTLICTNLILPQSLFYKVILNLIRPKANHVAQLDTLLIQSDISLDSIHIILEILNGVNKHNPKHETPLLAVSLPSYRLRYHLIREICFTTSPNTIIQDGGCRSSSWRLASVRIGIKRRIITSWSVCHEEGHILKQYQGRKGQGGQLENRKDHRKGIIRYVFCCRCRGRY
jgi:hypothetical protein